MRCSTPAIALLAGLSLSALSAAQPAGRVQFLPQFEEGQTMRYTIALDSAITQKEGDFPEFRQRVDQKLTLDFTVTTVDERGAVLEGTLRNVHVGAMWGGRMYAYVWPKVTTDEPMRLPPVIVLEQLGEAAREVKVRARVDVPSERGAGEVVVSGFEGVASALDEQDVFDMTTLGMLGNEQMADALERVFFIDGAPAKPIAPGTGWQTEERVTLGPAGAMNVTIEWVYRDREGDNATVVGSPRVAVERPAQADPAAPAVSLERQESTVEVVWNAALSRVESRRSTQAMATVWTLGPLTLSQTQDTTFTITRVE